MTRHRKHRNKASTPENATQLGLDELLGTRENTLSGDLEGDTTAKHFEAGAHCALHYPQETPTGVQPKKAKGSKPAQTKVARSPRTVDEISRVRDRQKVFLQKRREQKRLKVLYNRLRFVVKLCCIVLLGMALYHFLQAPFWVMSKPQLVIETAPLVPKAEVEQLLVGLAPKPITEVDPATLKAMLKERYPLLNHVTVRRSLFPAALRIQLIPKTVWGELYASPSATQPYALVTAHYDLVPVSSAHRRQHLFPKAGLTRLIIPPKTRVTRSTLVRLDQLAQQLSGHKSIDLAYLDYRFPEAVSAYLNDMQVKIGRLDATTTHRIKQLPLLVGHLSSLEKPVDAVDIRWQNQITLHEASPAEMKRLQEGWLKAHHLLKAHQRQASVSHTLTIDPLETDTP